MILELLLVENMNSHRQAFYDISRAHKNEDFTVVLIEKGLHFQWILIYGFNLAKLTRADSRRARSQRETSLQSNAVSHWLGANLEWALLVRFAMRISNNIMTAETYSYSLMISN